MTNGNQFGGFYRTVSGVWRVPAMDEDLYAHWAQHMDEGNPEWRAAWADMERAVEAYFQATLIHPPEHIHVGELYLNADDAVEKLKRVLSIVDEPAFYDRTSCDICRGSS